MKIMINKTKYDTEILNTYIFSQKKKPDCIVDVNDLLYILLHHFYNLPTLGIFISSLPCFSIFITLQHDISIFIIS
jgi:hypothetical protein